MAENEGIKEWAAQTCLDVCRTLERFRSLGVIKGGAVKCQLWKFFAELPQATNSQHPSLG